MSEVLNRYDRQERIEGWNQAKLKEAKVAIVGAGHIGNFLSASLAALGVGDLRIYDNEKIDYEIRNKPYMEREFLLSRSREGASKAEALEKRVQKINPLTSVTGIHMTLDNITESLVEPPDITVIATNDKDTIDRYRRLFSGSATTTYVAEGDRNAVLFSKIKPGTKIPDYTYHHQEAVNSEIISGFLCEEIVKKLMNGGIVELMKYNPNAYKLKGKKCTELVPLKNKKAIVVGAGALGNFLGIGLAHCGLEEIYLVDDDIVDVTNLNRQILFYDSVGKYKAEVLAERLMEINPDVKVTPIKERVTEKFENKVIKIKPDILFDCVDNLSTRSILNHFAIRNQIPLISGGTDYEKGQVVVYQPGKSACLNCRLNVDKALVEARRSSSCIYAPTPSVVIINHIIGGLMAAEGRCVLDPENYGSAVNQVIKYDSTKNVRVGLLGDGKPCECKREASAEEWIKKLLSDKAADKKADAA
jgi:molybdopterin/thiamine biosynthesis adenylyltransferase